MIPGIQWLTKKLLMWLKKVSRRYLKNVGDEEALFADLQGVKCGLQIEAGVMWIDTSLVLFNIIKFFVPFSKIS